MESIKHKHGIIVTDMPEDCTECYMWRYCPKSIVWNDEPHIGLPADCPIKPMTFDTLRSTIEKYSEELIANDNQLHSS